MNNSGRHYRSFPLVIGLHRMFLIISLVVILLVLSASTVTLTSTLAAPGSPTAVIHPFRQSVITPAGATRTAAIELYLPLLVRPSDDNAFITQVISLINSYRSLHGCPALAANAQLMVAAERHSKDMAMNDVFAHTGSDGSSPWDRIHAAGYTFSGAAENLAVVYPTPAAVAAAWYNEQPPNDGHRRNIINCAFRDTGVGYYYLENDTGNVNYHYYWTQVFATP